MKEVLILMGPSGVGKTSLVKAYTNVPLFRTSIWNNSLTFGIISRYEPGIIRKIMEAQGLPISKKKHTKLLIYTVLRIRIDGKEKQKQ